MERPGFRVLRAGAEVGRCGGTVACMTCRESMPPTTPVDSPRVATSGATSFDSWYGVRPLDPRYLASPERSEKQDRKTVTPDDDGVEVACAGRFSFALL